ncbi:cyclic nucleotide-binding domain-containing protein [Rhodobacteraceae bacterium M385]|nr:cyclic nucleotide-binding domain-containing protein [Rhodobacteraceae bacterium M385]
MKPEIRTALQSVGCAVAFNDGDVLREKGAFVPDMLLITSGQVDCIVSEADAVHYTVGPGTIVGEIGFLTGQGATATLRAVGPVEALSLNARSLQRLRQNSPAIAAEVLRLLATLLQERAAQNEGLVAEVEGSADKIEVVRCSTLDQRRTAQRVRYDVHCLERGLACASADDAEGTITDALDATGTSFIAFTGVQAIGMMRVNAGPDCEESLRRFHGLSHEADAAQNSTIITASAIHEAYQNAELFSQFIAAITTFAQASDATRLCADCPPGAEAHYFALGFQRSGPDAPLPELGLSVPLMLTALSDTEVGGG